MAIFGRLIGAAAASLLLAGTAFAAQPTANAERPAAKERLICKSVQETGSMARRLRQCFTRQEWDRIAEAARARGQRLQADMASGMTSN